ncbi:hypothetical protein [Priestia megaterium]|nr:hypothetical protein [Priestia megaterium]
MFLQNIILIAVEKIDEMMKEKNISPKNFKSELKKVEGVEREKEL